MIAAIVSKAKETGTKVAVIAGSVGLSQQQWRSFGVEAVIGICGDGVTEQEAMDDCERFLAERAGEFARKFLK